MNIPRFRRPALVAALVLALAAPTVVPAGAQPEAVDPGRKIEASLLTALDEAAEPLVIEFGDTADLGPAAAVKDWTQRGQAVVDALRETARRSQADVVAQLRRDGIAYTSYWVTNTVFVAGGTRQLATRAAADADVTAVRSAGTVELERPAAATAQAAVAGVEWGVANIKADQVWEQLGDRGEGIVVANIDSGVQFDHPALVGSYRGSNGDGTFSHDYNWYDPGKVCAPVATKPCDNNGHGSHTMGTMVGDGGAGNQVGVAPGARWMAAKGCEFNGCSEQSLTAAAQWILAPTDLAGQHPDVSKRPHIVNNSWGGPGGDDWYQGFVRAWVAAGIFPAFSNGNEGPDCTTTGAPGEYAEAYSVGNYRSDGTIADSSSRGPGTSGETKPNISAPGTDVRSTVPKDRYAVYTGTSMASPHLAATVALAWSAAPALVGDIDATRHLLDDTARDTADGQCGGTAADNNVYGEGQLDALAVVGSAPTGDVGRLQGTVTSGGKPVAGARVALTGPATRSATTGADGAFAISLTAGSYDLAVSKFGYETARVAAVAIAAGTVDTLDLALTPAPTVPLTGVVRDGGGHGWPLYAQVTVPDSPLSTFTDPVTGRYTLQVPAGATYRLAVEPRYAGYDERTDEVAVGTAATRHDVALAVDPLACAAPGYRRGAAGLHQGFDGGTAPAGWSVVDHGGTGQVWRFDDPGGQGNRTGGSGAFAVLDSDDYGHDGTQDSSLVSAPVDLTGVAAPVVEFRTDFKENWQDRADVDVSVDGGTTWTNVWRQTTDVTGPQRVQVALPTAANQPRVQVRFHYLNGSHDWWWQLDDVFVGDPVCAKAPGGLLVGRTTSSLTGAALEGVTVGPAGAAAGPTVSSATPDDDALGDGFYAVFAPSAHGRPAYTATLPDYVTRTERIQVRDDAVMPRDFALGSGRLTTSAGLDATVRPGRRTTVDLTITNTGDQPTSYTLTERDGPAPVTARATASVDGAPLRRVPADVSPLRDGGRAATLRAGGLPATVAADPAWTAVTPYPTPVKDAAVGMHGGKVYAFGGSLGGGDPLRTSYAYDPATTAWTPVADLPQGRQRPAGAFIDGRFVVTGGWGVGDFAPVAATSVYDPATDTWTEAAPNPKPWAASGTAVLDGRLYVVGGCNVDCGSTDVMRYDPVADTWTELAPYPQDTAWASCGGIAGKLYCAGGIGPRTDSLSTYVYDPATNAWSQVADLPTDMWGSAYAVVAGELVISGGAAERGSVITNESYAYDPATDSWRSLPRATYALYRTSGACGFYKVGGSDGTFRGDPAVELLPGYDDCAPQVDVGWMSARHATGTLKPGQRRTIQVTLDARAATKPGTYTANLRVEAATPYPVAPVPVTMVVR